MRRRSEVIVYARERGYGEPAKSVLKPGRLFEDLGARYFGPIDGHNIPELIEFLTRVRKMPGVNLVHVLTEKGRGLKSDA